MATWAIGDRIVETTTTELTGTYTLAGAVSSFVAFSARIPTGAKVFYCCTDGSSYEIGYGVLDHGPPSTLTREKIIKSSNGDNPVSWASGNKTIFVDIPAGFQLWIDPERQIHPQGFWLIDAATCGDGVTSAVNHWQQVIDAVSAAGGGRIIAPPGDYLFDTVNQIADGPNLAGYAVELKSNVEIVGVPGARIVGDKSKGATGGNAIEILNTTISTSGASTFTLGETVTGGTSGASGTVAENPAAQTLHLTGVAGTFSALETVTGGTSGASGTISAVSGDDVTVSLTSGFFEVGETVTGGTSGATGSVDTLSLGVRITRTAATLFARSETITGGTSGLTGTINQITKDQGYAAFHARGPASNIKVQGLEFDGGTDGAVIPGGLGYAFLIRYKEDAGDEPVRQFRVLDCDMHDMAGTAILGQNAGSTNLPMLDSAWFERNTIARTWAHGIAIRGLANADLIANHCSDCGLQINIADPGEPGGLGIDISSGSKSVTVTHNRFYRCRSGAAKVEAAWASDEVFHSNKVIFALNIAEDDRDDAEKKHYYAFRWVAEHLIAVSNQSDGYGGLGFSALVAGTATVVKQQAIIADNTFKGIIATPNGDGGPFFITTNGAVSPPNTVVASDRMIIHDNVFDGFEDDGIVRTGGISLHHNKFKNGTGHAIVIENTVPPTNYPDYTYDHVTLDNNEVDDGSFGIRFEELLYTDIPLTGVSGTFQVRETVTGGASGATGQVHKIDGSTIRVRNVTGAFVDAETVTGGTSGASGTSDGPTIGSQGSKSVTVNGQKIRNVTNNCLDLLSIEDATITSNNIDTSGDDIPLNVVRGKNFTLGANTVKTASFRFAPINLTQCDNFSIDTNTLTGGHGAVRAIGTLNYGYVSKQTLARAHEGTVTLTGVSGDFVEGEVIVGGTSGCKAIVVNWDSVNGVLAYRDSFAVSGPTFSNNETITGDTSLATGTMQGGVNENVITVDDNVETDWVFEGREYLNPGLIADGAAWRCNSHSYRVLDITGISGAPEVGETVTGGTSGSSGRVSRVDTTMGRIKVYQPTGAFSGGESLGFGTSGASATVDTDHGDQQVLVRVPGAVSEDIGLLHPPPGGNLRFFLTSANPSADGTAFPLLVNHTGGPASPAAGVYTVRTRHVGTSQPIAA